MSEKDGLNMAHMPWLNLGRGVFAGCSGKILEQAGQVIKQQRTGDGDVSQGVARVSVPELFAFRMVEEELHKLIQGEPGEIDIGRLVHGDSTMLSALAAAEHFQCLDNLC